VKKYKGAAYSGEHGDGLVRSEWIEPIIGSRLVRGASPRSRTFRSEGLMNPGKNRAPVQAGRQEPVSLQARLRGPEVRSGARLERMERAGAASAGFAAAVEMCNNNGHCRKFRPRVRCARRSAQPAMRST